MSTCAELEMSISLMRDWHFFLAESLLWRMTIENWLLMIFTRFWHDFGTVLTA